MSNFIFRAAIASDAPALQQLLRQLEHPLSEAEIIEKIKSYQIPHYYLMVIETDHHVVGFASLHWYDVFYAIGYIGRITAFCVDQQFRSKGIGQKLLQATEDYFLRHNCIRIEVSSNERRAGAHRFYLNNGFINNSKRFIKNLVN
jgi:GNAT superfamily N-acetyltransferase